MKAPVWLGRVNDKGDKVDLFDSSRYAQWRSQLKGKEIELILRKKVAVRSTEQNAYLHFIFGEIADYTGHTLEEIKTEMKRLFASSVDAHGLPYLEHTSQMDTARCSKFTEDVVGWAAMELGLSIETPEEHARRTQEL